MMGDRPAGVRLIAAYLFVKATALIMAVMIGYTIPDLRPKTAEFISNIAFKIGVSLPLLTALLDFVLGVGIWLLKGWSRTVIVLTNAYGLCRIAIGSALLMELDRKYLSSQTSSPYFAVNVVAAVLILLYLLQPDVKRIFGEPT